MAITRDYDEMADRYTYRGRVHQLNKNKYGIGDVSVQPAFVDLKDGGDTFWFMFYRKGPDWYWINNTNFIILADNQRFTGAGFVKDAEAVPEPEWFQTTVYCHEWIHCGAHIDVMKVIAKASSLKARLGEADMVLPQAFIDDVKEIVDALESGNGYGV